MGVKKLEKNKGEFRVYVVRKSKLIPGLKVCRGPYFFKTQKEADRKKTEIIAKAERDLKKREDQGSLWLNLIGEWEMAVREGSVFAKSLTEGTLKDYLSSLKNHTKEWFDIPAGEITKAMAWRLLDEIERAYSKDNRKKLRAAIDSVFKWAYLSGSLKGSGGLPTEGFKSNLKTEEKIPEILNLKEIKMLLKTAKAHEHDWYSVWAMALLTGMRSGELYALRWEKVDLEKRILYVCDNWTNKSGFGPTKGRYWRTIPISSELAKLLKELKLKTGNTEFVLPRLWEWKQGQQAKILRTFCISIGLTSVRFHTLRSCFATQLIKDGVAPAIIMKICGWKDLKTMQRYIRLSGVEVDGATDDLKILPAEQVMGRVVELFSS